MEPFKIAYERELKQRDWERWQLGMYIKEAQLSLWNSDSHYPEKPYLDESNVRNMKMTQKDENGEDVLTPEMAEQARERLVMQMKILESRNKREKLRKELYKDKQTEG